MNWYKEIKSELVPSWENDLQTIIQMVQGHGNKNNVPESVLNSLIESAASGLQKGYDMEQIRRHTMQSLNNAIQRINDPAA